MTNGTTHSNGPQFSTAQLVTSAVMVGAGTFFILTGLAVGSSHLLQATRKWVKQMDVPPSELAKLKYAQARSAVSAGTAAWRNGTQANSASVS